MWRIFVLLFGACGPAMSGDYHGVDTATRTETTLSLRPDGSYVLQFAPKAGPRVTLEGRYSSPDGDALALDHARLVVDEGSDVVVSERAEQGALCAPLSDDRELCVKSHQLLASRFEEDRLRIESPPFAFMAKSLHK